MDFLVQTTPADPAVRLPRHRPSLVGGWQLSPSGVLPSILNQPAGTLSRSCSSPSRCQSPLLCRGITFLFPSTPCSSTCPSSLRSADRVRQQGEWRSHAEAKIVKPLHRRPELDPTQFGLLQAPGLEKIHPSERRRPSLQSRIPLPVWLSVVSSSLRALAIGLSKRLQLAAGWRVGTGSSLSGVRPRGRTSQARVTRRPLRRALGRWDHPAGTQAPKPTLLPTPDDLDRIPPSHIFLHSPPTRSDLGRLHAPFATTDRPLLDCRPTAPLTAGYQTGKVAVPLVSASLLFPPARHARG